MSRRRVSLVLRDQQQLPEGEITQGEARHQGSIIPVQGGYRIEYRHQNQEGDRTQTAFDLVGDEVTLTRQGAVGLSLTFVPGAVCQAYYQTPYGELPVRAETLEACWEVSGPGGWVWLRYRLFMQGQYVSENTIDLRLSYDA